VQGYGKWVEPADLPTPHNSLKVANMVTRTIGHTTDRSTMVARLLTKHVAHTNVLNLVVNYDIPAVVVRQSQI